MARQTPYSSLVLLLVAVMAQGCAGGENLDGDLDTIYPTPIPDSGGIPPTNVPPTNVPPTNVPPTNVPPTNTPPTNVPPSGGFDGGVSGGFDTGVLNPVRDAAVIPVVDTGTATSDGGAGDSSTSIGDGAAPSSDSGAVTGGTCCKDGNCLCHGTVPARLSAQRGPFQVRTLQLSTGVAHYPTNADAPFAGISICPGFLNSGPEMADWGAFYASWGIVTVVTNTLGTDVPEIRATKLLNSIKALKAENTKSGSPLNGKMSGRYGTSGYSMGGGGTTMASVTDPTLMTSVGLAPWEPVGRNIKTPTLLMCGSADAVAPCSYVDNSYSAIPNTTPKMKLVIRGGEHLFTWFGPNDGGNGTSGGYALAFQKVFLEGDERWKPLLLAKPSGHDMTTNITP
jgi:pimeloyl-ACP methyl ester carboxylesterase